VEPLRTDDAPRPWSAVERLLFRFLFAYLVLYMLPFPVDALSLDEVYGFYQSLWRAVVPWVGERLLGLEVTFRASGSGDTTYNYVQVLCFALIAAATAAAWTLADRKRLHHARLAEWLRVYLRFYLATTLIAYGAFKVVKSQFPGPTLDRLLQPFGDASPMGLLWTFMGLSPGYNLFTGAGEVLAGALLTARRTTLAGSLLAVAVMGHVVVLNFCYDVPVKLLSLHLLAMAVVLLAPDLRRLAGFLLLNRAVAPARLRPLFARTWLHRGAFVLRTLFIVAVAWQGFSDAHEARATYGDGAPRPPLYGIWEVEEFTVDGEVRPPLTTDAERWRRVVFTFPGTMGLQLMGDSRRRFGLELDAGAGTLALTRRDDPAWRADLAYQEPEPGVLTLAGTWEGRVVRARLRRADESKFLLVGRGFHWINEYPYNR
jgi:hypothetical protein